MWDWLQTWGWLALILGVVLFRLAIIERRARDLSMQLSDLSKHMDERWEAHGDWMERRFADQSVKLNHLSDLLDPIEGEEE